MLERKGARVAFLVTRGFRDLLRIRTEARYDLYDLGIRYPEPLCRAISASTSPSGWRWTAV